jgi:integrase
VWSGRFSGVFSLLAYARPVPRSLCARADGEPVQPQSLTHEFPRFLPRLGSDFPRVRFHDFRHSHATQLLVAGVHPKVAQERLEHSTVTTTLDLYSHVAATMQENAAGRLDVAFRGAITTIDRRTEMRPLTLR